MVENRGMQVPIWPSHLTTDAALGQVLLTLQIRLNRDQVAPFTEALRRPELVVGSVIDLNVQAGQSNVLTYRDGKSTAKLGPEDPASTRHFLSGAFDWPPEQAPSRALQPSRAYRLNLALSDNDQRLKTFLNLRVVQTDFACIFSLPGTARQVLNLEFM